VPRQARQQSKSGIYHLIIRGINKQVIFEDDEDRERFLWCLEYYKELSKYNIYGYCLMNNHIHLLIKEGNESIAKTMKRIGVSYVLWFNKKYGRCGHLFQDRFKSEAVETDEYFLMVLRYIHQNPLKTGEWRTMETYPWSSYREYFEQNKRIELNFTLELFSKEPKVAMESLKRFMNEKTNDITAVVYSTNKLTDYGAKIAIQTIAQLDNLSEIQTLEKGKRNEVLRQIKKVEGISTRQIARLTGITQSVVVRA
jgi:putative transposase